MLKKYYEDIYNNRYVLISLVQRDLITKYRRSKLGVAWSVLMPLGLALIVGAVYSILFHYPAQKMMALILAGINPWTFMVGAADGATMTFPAAEGYIKQSTVPTTIFPLRIVLTNFITLLYSVITFFCVYLFLSPDSFGPSMLLCIPGLVIMFMFALGLANMSSVANMYVRDFAPFQSLVFQGLFYATPIIYDPQMLAERGYAFVYELNPFYYMLEVVRGPMLGNIPNMHSYLIAIVMALAVFCAGVLVQEKQKEKIVYLL